MLKKTEAKTKEVKAPPKTKAAPSGRWVLVQSRDPQGPRVGADKRVAAGKWAQVSPQEFAALEAEQRKGRCSFVVLPADCKHPSDIEVA